MAQTRGRGRATKQFMRGFQQWIELRVTSSGRHAHCVIARSGRTPYCIWGCEYSSLASCRRPDDAACRASPNAGVLEGRMQAFFAPMTQSSIVGSSGLVGVPHSVAGRLRTATRPQSAGLPTRACADPDRRRAGTQTPPTSRQRPLQRPGPALGAATLSGHAACAYGSAVEAAAELGGASVGARAQGRSQLLQVHV